MQEKPRFPERFDLIVVGAGHAGCEAAMAAARMGLDTLLLTINVERIGHLSCNPAIGGLAKGHMVKEIDALGGMMGLWADAAGIQFRVLNTRKGPAVRSSRAQIDRAEYMRVVQRSIFNQDHLWVFQDMADAVLVEDGRAAGVRTQLGEILQARSVLLTTGTFLRGLVHVGLNHFGSGRMGDPPSNALSDSLRAVGLELGRLKTGTTPRLLKSSIDFSKMQEQPGDNPPRPFSFRNTSAPMPQVSCWLTYTNPEAHEIIRSGFDRSPMFTGVIEGTGARYCPSIEDKVARFPEKDRHQIFVEPEGLDHPEMYPSGIPTSLPFDVQKRMVRAVVGLENAQIVRPGYAIEYDFAPPTQLLPTLETKVLPGLYLAGQINGTSGYEEAAAQGMWAAVNAACALTGRPPFLLRRDQAYMAVLVDDLVTKGTREPYRMFTSRAEHRLLLREGNADERLTGIGRELGLVDDGHWKLFSAKQDRLRTVLEGLHSIRVRPDAPTRDLLNELGAAVPGKAVELAALLRQPQVEIGQLAVFYPELAGMDEEVLREAETQVRYEGYLVKQEELVAKFRRLEDVPLPADLDYSAVAGFTREVVEKLSAVRPVTLGQAGRISGVTPAALACLEIHLKKQGVL
ncbi:tRNA uridine-5-carboxymethylaminomethyl(34) synthesis enzyme MnmG [Pseudodesulfovibrio sp.]|uniref:tRNA uridine-5-carboxymethylaminomethyl(34) synthesis enzyme MnmG n=1 Tax=Pseudodesulfovibrio sp. TaxID=2035812 RepID=UPI00263605F7|nr:tRNA uridine-5-carboxymethylaminomethyl(34) synthesis enzyme MnmG [Pseudodesulfovibrio sp.]MDD3312051.1 tRNA uridine-5-carboxymethylaminomethyl(34) synthesis enzyme MnmG [Pseudodesulfovibrio sp.]